MMRLTFLISLIYTRAGDKGITGLLSGERIDKADPRVEAFGTVDELGTFLGVAKVQKPLLSSTYVELSVGELSEESCNLKMPIQ